MGATMPADDTLPASRLPLLPDPAQVLRYFPEVFGIREDTEGLDALPEPDRLRLAGARPLEPPEAVLLDRVLQLVPTPLLRPIERIIVVPTRGTGHVRVAT